MQRSLDFFQDCCAARGVFDIGNRALEDGGLPDPRELSTIAMEAIGRAQSRTGCALVHWDPGLIRMCQGAGGTASASGASEASAEDSPLFATSIGEIKTAARAARDADLAYKQVVKRLDGQEFCEMDRTMREIGMREYYLPTLAFLSHWQEGLITAYMHELGIRGQFDLDPLMDFSTDRSDAMLANLSRATNTRELLVQAFVACPYNEDVYIKADELGSWTARAIAVHATSASDRCCPTRRRLSSPHSSMNLFRMGVAREALESRGRPLTIDTRTKQTPRSNPKTQMARGTQRRRANRMRLNPHRAGAPSTRRRRCAGRYSRRRKITT